MLLNLLCAFCLHIHLIAEKKISELSSEEKKNIPPPPPPVPVPVNKKEHLKQQAHQKNAVGPKYVELNIRKMNENKEVQALKASEIPIQPTFSGGMEKFYQFVGTNFKIPEEASKNKINGKVYLSFIVEIDGSLSDFKILRDLGYGVGDEAIRVLKQSPKWIPGTVDGKPVRIQYSLPLSVISK